MKIADLQAMEASIKINKVFQNNLESIVLELNEYLYDDGGNVA